MKLKQEQKQNTANIITKVEVKKDPNAEKQLNNESDNIHEVLQVD